MADKDVAEIVPLFGEKIARHQRQGAHDVQRSIAFSQALGDFRLGELIKTRFEISERMLVRRATPIQVHHVYQRHVRSFRRGQSKTGVEARNVNGRVENAGFAEVQVKSAASASVDPGV